MDAYTRDLIEKNAREAIAKHARDVIEKKDVIEKLSHLDTNLNVYVGTILQILIECFQTFNSNIKQKHLQELHKWIQSSQSMLFEEMNQLKESLNSYKRYKSQTNTYLNHTYILNLCRSIGLIIPTEQNEKLQFPSQFEDMQHFEDVLGFLNKMTTEMEYQLSYSVEIAAITTMVFAPILCTLITLEKEVKYAINKIYSSLEEAQIDKCTITLSSLIDQMENEIPRLIAILDAYFQKESMCSPYISPITPCNQYIDAALNSPTVQVEMKELQKLHEEIINIKNKKTMIFHLSEGYKAHSS